MANFARIDENNVVLTVIVVPDSILLREDGSEDEEKGIEFCKMLMGPQTNWKQTSYNNNMRVRYAGIGGVYNPELDAFLPPKPYESWVINEETADWIPPIPLPDDGKYYQWNEVIRNWTEIV